jgi:hypothetical protein
MNHSTDQENNPMHVSRWLLCLLLCVLTASAQRMAWAQADPWPVTVDGIRPSAPVSGEPIRALLSSPSPVGFNIGTADWVTVTVLGDVIRIHCQMVGLLTLPGWPLPDVETRAVNLGPFPRGDYRIEIFVWWYWQTPETAVLVDTFEFSVAQAPAQVIPTHSPWALLLLIGTAALLGRAAIARE